MCGIVGYVGERPCKELLLTGLERLEYRGYDSAGICLINGEVDITRRVGRVQELRDAVGSAAHPATTGLAHTRWATHGGPAGMGKAGGRGMGGGADGVAQLRTLPTRRVMSALPLIRQMPAES